MFVCRLVKESDFDRVYDLTRQVHSGLTTLLLGRLDLKARIMDSVKNVHFPPRRPQGESFFFVLEDLESKAVIGTSAVFSKVGGFQPFWTYEILESHKVCKRLHVDHKVPYLQVRRIHDGPSEIGSLFLQKDFRYGTNGRLLSLSRFLFMAQYSGMFEDTVVAEMRGRVDLDGASPFWNAIGAHFFGLSFEQADLQSNVDKNFIDDLMPVHPIYIPLLPKEAQEIIGQVHPETEAALRLLESEGFVKTNFVDVFEAGPTLECDLAKIRSVAESQESSLWTAVRSVEEGEECLLANVSSLERFSVTVAEVKDEDGEILIEHSVAKALKLKSGDKLRYVRLRGEVNG